MAAGDLTYLFLHMMKTGGTTFGAHLEDNFPPGSLYPDDRTTGPDHTPDWIRYGSLSRLREAVAQPDSGIRAFRGHFPFLATEIVRPDVTITLLRDPVERIVSALRQVQRADGADPRSLEEIYETDPSRWTIVQDYQARQFALTSEELEATGRLIDGLFPDREVPGADVAHYAYVAMDDTRLERAVANVAQVDVIGLREDYGRFLAELQARFGWHIAADHRRRRAVDVEEVAPALARTIATDSAYDVEFYERVVRTILPGRWSPD